MTLDSLRHWVESYHIDGFRFDLAPALVRTPFDVVGSRRLSPGDHAQDPVLSRVKLIAEAWDLGPGGYRVGGFPTGWGDWNDRFRDTVRAFWRGDQRSVAPNLASRLSGSSDLFNHSGRKPWASVQYVASHDGFTLQDVVSYNNRHNLPNGENNKDGHEPNYLAQPRRRGADAGCRDHRRPQQAEAQPAGDRAPGDRHADAADGRRVLPQPGRQQQRLLPGQCGRAGWPGTTSTIPRLVDYVANLVALAQEPRRVPSPRVFHGPCDRRRPV